MAVWSSPINFYSELGEQSLAIILENMSRIGQEIIEILKFMELNVTAIRKILKKFDKKFKGQHGV